jgi:hypothetical protein
MPAKRAWSAAIVLAAAVALLAWAIWPRRIADEAVASDDPRLSYPTPYRNVHPQVRYVGDRACAGCHTEIAETYRHHPMGRALAPVETASPIERYDAKANNPFRAGQLSYTVERRGARVRHRESAGPVALQVEVAFALGSGARARSYLIDRDGYLFQSPVTWYPHARRWELSPSYEQRNQHFNRPITPGCLFCHANFAEHVPHTVNRYRPPIFRGHAIGCERCHGPGELHVRRHTDGEAFTPPDETIVNPAKLEHSLREAVCQQCHLQGEQRVLVRGRADFDYRPGLPLQLFAVDFVDARDRGAEAKFVGTVEQMVGSRCYGASRDPKKLGCASCHDAHKHPAPAERVAHYRGRCLQCHTEASCRLPPAARRQKSKDDSCIECHMPRAGSEVNHTSITDHRVPRRADPVQLAAKRHSPPGPDDLVPFHAGPSDNAMSRAHGLALMAMLNTGPPDDVARRFAAKALPMLERALGNDDDPPAREARGDALLWLGRHEEALSAYVQVLLQAPESESTLDRAGTLSLTTNQPRAARSFYERAVRVNPYRWHHHEALARASFRLGEWQRAAGECRQALELHPANTATRSLLVQCLLAAGDREQAAAEYETIRRLTPEDRRERLRLWFEERLRQLARP